VLAGQFAAINPAVATQLTAINPAVVTQFTQLLELQGPG